MRTVFASMGAALFATALSATAAMAGMEEQAPQHEAPGLVVSFQGGLAGRNFFDVLDAISKSGAEIPKEPVTIQANDSVCRLLVRRGYPPDCLALARFVDTLNPETKLMGRSLQIGETLQLPQLQVSSYQAVNNYARSIPRQAEFAKKLTKAYKEHDAKLVENADSVSVEYKAYELYVPVKSDQDATDLADRLYALGLDNVFIDPLTKDAPPAALNSYTADEARDLCDSNDIGSRVYNYAELVDTDADVAEIVRHGLPAEPRKVSVTLIDTKLTPSPNLWPAFGDAAPPPQPWRCKWRKFVIGEHHATHLAGIIASSQKAFGFAGVAPNVKLNSFVWVTPDQAGDLQRFSADRAPRLARVIGGRKYDFPLPVYLAATNFDALVQGGPEVRLSKDKEALRTKGVLLGTIATNKPLLIVAAGHQSDSTMEGIELEPRSNASPQNLGDYQNVVVVTACRDCDRGEERLMRSANQSRKGEYMVHVAAPGGASVPGWITDHEIGASGGTSQASAFVAGVAASMIGAFPEAYATPVAVKTRLQATSRPLSLKDGGKNPDAEKLTTGVVDPVLALLDPRRNWIKDSQGWREARIKSWPGEGLAFLGENGSREPSLNDRQLLRVVRTPNSDPATWTIYADRFEMGRSSEGGSVERYDLATLQAGALTLCDGSTVDFREIDDLILKMGSEPDVCAPDPDPRSARMLP
jgi:hypothetical protein